MFWALGGRLALRLGHSRSQRKACVHTHTRSHFCRRPRALPSDRPCLGRAGVFSALVPAALFKWPVLILGFVFLVRAVGEFKLVGLFKRVRGTSFARWDTWLFSPLCLGISCAALWLSLR